VKHPLFLGRTQQKVSKQKRTFLISFIENKWDQKKFKRERKKFERKLEKEEKRRLSEP
jgi:hypothetical protein